MRCFFFLRVNGSRLGRHKVLGCGSGMMLVSHVVAIIMQGVL